MTDVMNARDVEIDADAGPDLLDALDRQLVDQLAGRARQRGLQLVGEGGLLAQLTKQIVESALDQSMLWPDGQLLWPEPESDGRHPVDQLHKPLSSGV